LITAVPDQAAAAQAARQRSEARVSAGELASMINEWPAYRGRTIQSDEVRAWLEQFGDEVNQRRAFKVLQSLQFVSDGASRVASRHLHRPLAAGRARTPATKATFRDVLVVSPDPQGKSGSVYARLYAQETQTHLQNVCDLHSLADRLKG